MKRILFIFLLLSTTQTLFGGDAKIDSQESRLEIVSGKEKVDVLNSLT